MKPLKGIRRLKTILNARVALIISYHFLPAFLLRQALNVKFFNAQISVETLRFYYD